MSDAWKTATVMSPAEWADALRIKKLEAETATREAKIKYGMMTGSVGGGGGTAGLDGTAYITTGTGTMGTLGVRGMTPYDAAYAYQQAYLGGREQAHPLQVKTVKTISAAEIDKACESNALDPAIAEQAWDMIASKLA